MLQMAGRMGVLGTEIRLRGVGARQGARGAGPVDHQSRHRPARFPDARSISSRPGARRSPTAITATPRPTASSRLREAVAADLHRRHRVDRVARASADRARRQGHDVLRRSMMFGEPGAEIIYPNPGFPIYESVIRFSGATPVPMPLHEAPGLLLQRRGGARQDHAADPAHHHQQPGQPDRRRRAAGRA